MTKRMFYNRGSSPVSPDAPTDAVKREFAKRLQAMLDRRGWNQAELARRAAFHMPNGKFGRDNVSNYVRGVVLPTPTHLNAMALALGCDSQDLLPSRAVPSVDAIVPAFEVKQLSASTAWVRINQELPWPIALKIMQLVKGWEWDTSRNESSQEP